ncbi:MAG: mercury methylation corrinoid protein HgcA [Kiritimatiellae bacterium]|nr:mercury methylation corrinoid protein HgcA [Kiritimatiellia bacterium]
MSQGEEIPRVSTSLTSEDIMGAIKVRLSISRMDYAVEPGLYVVGSPDATSPVLVSANYKLSFDNLRKELEGLDVWILVLDTKGVNVWCSAGKGTFGTEEIVGRVRSVGLDKMVSHRKLILPQLSAPGVAAHKVKGDCGFQVIYGPVRASDIKNFLKAGMKTTPEMRRVRFDFLDRLVVVPVEIIQWAPHVFLLGLVMVALSGIVGTGYDVNLLCTRGFMALIIVLSTFLAGSILCPALLPWLPGKAFSIKGMWVGFIIWGILVLSECGSTLGIHFPLEAWAWLPIILAIISFIAMNFTGCSTFTSQSGVKREMRYAIPVQILLLVIGIALWIKAGLL